MKLYWPLVALLLGLPSLNANAERIKALTIVSEYFPDSVYELGFDLAANRAIERVYFQERGYEPELYTLEQLKSSFVTVFRKMGLNFVNMKIVKMGSPTSGVIELSYLKNVVFGRRQRIFYDVDYDAGRNTYRIVEESTGREVRHLEVVVNYKAGMPIGVREIREK